MSHSNEWKRLRLVSVLDRLHVENAISSKKSSRSSCDQVNSRKFVNPLLLRQRRKHIEELITVIPNGTDKTKGHIYKRLQSKPSEGGTVICELCGRRSFKSYSKTLQASEDGGSLRGVTKKVCRQCHDVDGGSTKVTPRDKSRTRPYYEPPLIGLTAERASKSWYFIRRDFVLKKQNKLQQNRCDENEYSRNYLSDASSRESDTSMCESDEDTDYLSDDSDKLRPCEPDTECLPTRTDDIPEIHRRGHSYINDLKNDQGYQDHLVLRHELYSDSDKSLSPEDDEAKPPKTFIKRPDEVGRIGHLLDDQNKFSTSLDLALAVSQDKEVSNVPLAIDVDLSHGDHTYFTRPTYLAESMEDKAGSLVCSSNTTKDIHTTSVSSEDDYVEIEYLDDDIVECLLKDIDDDLEVKCVNSGDENYVCNQHLTPFFCGESNTDDNLHDFESKPACFRVIRNIYSKNTNEKNIRNRKDNLVPSFNKGVCRLVTVINKKRSHYKDGSFNSCFYDSTGMYCKKRDLPSFIQLDDRKVYKLRHTAKRKGVNELLLKYSPVSPDSPGTVKGSSCVVDEENLTLKELKEKFLPRSTSGGGVEGLSGYICGVCKQIVKSYSSKYNRNNAPAKFLQHFNETENSIRICRNCLLGISISDAAGSPSTNNSTNTEGSSGTLKICPVVKKRKMDQQGNERTPKFRRFSRFIDTPIEVVSPKVSRTYEHATFTNPILLPKPKVVVDALPSGAIALNEEIGKILIKNSSPQSSFGRLNLKVVQNPNESQIKNIAQNCKTKYVIVQTAPTSGESKVQKLSTDKSPGKLICGETKLGNHGDITINGQKYKIDTEFKLNDLVKDNENAFSSAETKKDILTCLPSILKRTPHTKDGTPPQCKIVNVVESSSSLSSTCASSKSLSLPSCTQKFILQSIAPAPRKDNLQGTTFSSSTPTILPKVSFHVKGQSPFSATDYTVVQPKKLQCIAPKTTSSTTTYMTEFSSADLSNAVSHVDTSLYPRVSSGNLSGAKRNTVILHVSKPEPVTMNTITNGENSLETDVYIKHSTKATPALKEASAVQFPGTNMVDVYAPVPENVAHHLSQKIIMNPPAVPVCCVSSQSSIPYIISATPLTSSATSHGDAIVAVSSSNPVGEVKPLVINCTRSSPSKSLHGVLNTIVGNASTSSTPNSTATCVINTASRDLNSLITTTNSIIPLLAPISTTKNTSTVSHLVISASSYKPWMSTSTAISSSLVKSINELRASSTTITTPNKMAPIIVRSVSSNENATGNAISNLISKHVKIKSPVKVGNSTAPRSHKQNSLVNMKGNFVPLTKFVSNQNSSVVTLTHSEQHSVTKSVNNAKIVKNTNIDSACSPRYVVVNKTVPSITANSAPSLYQQTLQHSEIIACEKGPLKSCVKLAESNISCRKLLSSSVNQNGDSEEMKPSSNNILDLNNRIKLVGSFVKNEDTTPHFCITPVSNSVNNQGSVTPRTVT